GIQSRVVITLHPRTRKALEESGELARLIEAENITVLDPLGYLDMLALEERAALVLTDSGGVQREAFFVGTPCVTLRDETEWLETVEAGWNIVAGTSPTAILEACEELLTDPPAPLAPEEN